MGGEVDVDMYRSSMNGLRLVLGGMKIVLVNGRFLLLVAQLMSQSLFCGQQDSILLDY